MELFLSLIRTLLALSVVIHLVSSYLIVNKLWSRRGVRGVAESISISAALLGLATSLPFLVHFSFVEPDPAPAARTAISVGVGVVFVLIAAGIFVGEYRGRGFARLLLAALRLERTESADLLKALVRPAGARELMVVFEAMAAVDKHVDAPRQPGRRDRAGGADGDDRSVRRRRGGRRRHARGGDRAADGGAEGGGARRVGTSMTSFHVAAPRSGSAGPVPALVAALAFAACERPPEPVPVDPDVHRAAVEAFHAAREAELRAPDSWLSLIGLHWLEEGETTLGADSANDIVLPAGKAPAVLGTVTLHDSVATFRAAPGVEVTVGIDSTLSLPAGSGAIPPDVSRDPVVREAVLGSAGPGKSRVVRYGPLNWILLRRGDRFALRVRDNTSPVYDAFHGIDRYPTDLRWRLTARWVPHEKTVAVPNVLGTVSEEPSPAHLAFRVGGREYTLDVTGDADAERFMLVFADGTSGRTTYGGGRYVWVDAPDEQGRVVLDFNLAYNPPCVWTPYATCPLPSRDNRLPIAVEAGEKDWKHE